MQAEIVQAKSLLNLLEQDYSSMTIDESEAKSLELMSCLKSVFESKQPLLEKEQQTLIELNERLAKLCVALEQAKKNSKDELSKILKNKKKVGLYNQLK